MSSTEGPPGPVQQDEAADKNRATVPVGRAAVTAINGDQQVERVWMGRRRTGVESTEGVITPAARSQRDRGSNLHQRCRTRGVSRPT